MEVKLKDGSTISADTVWEAFSDSLEQYTLEYVSEVTEVPVDKIEEGVRIYTTRLNPLHGNGGIHYQLAPDQTGHAVQNTRALQLIACITGNSDAVPHRQRFAPGRALRQQGSHRRRGALDRRA